VSCGPARTVMYRHAPSVIEALLLRLQWSHWMMLLSMHVFIYCVNLTTAFESLIRPSLPINGTITTNAAYPIVASSTASSTSNEGSVSKEKLVLEAKEASKAAEDGSLRAHNAANAVREAIASTSASRGVAATVAPATSSPAVASASSGSDVMYTYHQFYQVSH
jgi:hypothetical protein